MGHWMQKRRRKHSVEKDEILRRPNWTYEITLWTRKAACRWKRGCETAKPLKEAAIIKKKRKCNADFRFTLFFPLLAVVYLSLWSFILLTSLSPFFVRPLTFISFISLPPVDSLLHFSPEFRFSFNFFFRPLLFLSAVSFIPTSFSLFFFYFFFFLFICISVLRLLIVRSSSDGAANGSLIRFLCAFYAAFLPSIRSCAEFYCHWNNLRFIESKIEGKKPEKKGEEERKETGYLLCLFTHILRRYFAEYSISCWILLQLDLRSVESKKNKR